MIGSLLGKLKTYGDPALQEGEFVVLRGPGGLGRGGTLIIGGFLVLTNVRLCFRPRAPRVFGIGFRRIEIPLSAIVALAPSGRRSLLDPFPRLQRINVVTSEGQDYVLQTFRWETWKAEIMSLTGRKLSDT